MAEETKRIIQIDGRDVEYVEVYDMTLDELEKLMTQTGCTPVEAEQALRLGNPAAWKSVLTIAAQRKRPGGNVEAAIGKMKLGEVIETVFPDAESEPEEDEGDPPTVAAVEPPPTSQIDSGQAEIRAISGSQ